MTNCTTRRDFADLPFGAAAYYVRRHSIHSWPRAVTRANHRAWSHLRWPAKWCLRLSFVVCVVEGHNQSERLHALSALEEAWRVYNATLDQLSPQKIAVKLPAVPGLVENGCLHQQPRPADGPS
jgi:hypothetical protein